MSYSIELDRTIACLPKTQRGQFVVLGGDPKGQNILYPSGNSLVIRDITNPSISDIYSEHSYPVTVGKYSPSGFYIASADQSGIVRVWDTTQKEHILKNEFQKFSGPIRNLVWSADNQKMALGGQGRESFGAVFNADMGSNLGTISGMTKMINALDFKSTRPFRLATGSEDSAVSFFEGPPFKIKKNNYSHQNFVNCLQYAPSGAVFVSGDADGRILIFDGKEGELLAEFKDSEAGLTKAHQGGVYGVCFDPSSSLLVSVSADKTVKVWEMPAEPSQSAPPTKISQFQSTNVLPNMLVGCQWIGEVFVALRLSGDFLVFRGEDARTLSHPPTIITGHQAPICHQVFATGLRRIASADTMGNILFLDPETGLFEKPFDASTGNQVLPHGTNKIDGLEIDQSAGRMYTVGVDDRLVCTQLSAAAAASDSSAAVAGDGSGYVEMSSVWALSLPSRPFAVSHNTHAELVGVACAQHLVFVRAASGEISGSIPFTTLFGSDADCQTTAIAFVPGNSRLLVMAFVQKHHLLVLRVNEAGNDVERVGEPIDFGDSVSCLQFSACGSLLAVGDSKRKVTLYRVDASNATSSSSPLSPAHKHIWQNHASRITCVAISPDLSKVASGSIDASINVWSVEQPDYKVNVFRAHQKSIINTAVWVDNLTFFTSDQNGIMKKWRVV